MGPRHLIAVLGILSSTLLATAGDAHASGPAKLKQPSVFPITITKSGSYVLVGNITVADANTTAIVVNADAVTIDLAGFAITGPTSCTGSPPSCSPSGSGVGIQSGNTDVVVENGTVRGMGSYGIVLGNRATVSRVRAVSNGACGIAVGLGPNEVKDNTADQNGGCGISVAGTGNTVTGNRATQNGFDGVDGGQGSLYSANTVTFNGIGLSSSGGPGSGAGLYVGADNTLTLNTVSGNGGYGIDVRRIDNPQITYGGTAYHANVLNGNNGGDTHPQVVGGIAMPPNTCGGDTVCP